MAEAKKKKKRVRRKFTGRSDHSLDKQGASQHPQPFPPGTQ